MNVVAGWARLGAIMGAWVTPPLPPLDQPYEPGHEEASDLPEVLYHGVRVARQRIRKPVHLALKLVGHALRQHELVGLATGLHAGRDDGKFLEQGEGVGRKSHATAIGTLRAASSRRLSLRRAARPRLAIARLDGAGRHRRDARRRRLRLAAQGRAGDPGAVGARRALLCGLCSAVSGAVWSRASGQ